MISKLISPKGHIAKIVRSQCRRMSEYSVKEYKPAHMNEVPIPQGSWEEGFKRKQFSNNCTLAFGIVFFTATITYVYNAGDIVFYGIPPRKND